MAWLTDDEFRRRHSEHLGSALWKEFRGRALAHAKFRCCVCGEAYLRRGHSKWQLQVDHKRYKDDNGDLIFGKETLADVRICCPDHHGKGVRSDYAMNEWRKSYRLVKALGWLTKMVFRILRWFMTLPFRSLKALLDVLRGRA